MAIPNWRDTSSDWPFHRDLATSCDPLKDLTLNDDALIHQQIIMSGGDNSSIIATPLDNWVAKNMYGVTFRGNEPWNYIQHFLYYKICMTGCPDPPPSDCHPLWRIYNVERNEYYPHVAGTVLEEYDIPCPGGGYDLFYCSSILIPLVPPSGPWNAGSYELRTEHYFGSAWCTCATLTTSACSGELAMLIRLVI